MVSYSLDSEVVRMTVLIGDKLRDYISVSLEYQRNFVQQVIEYCNSDSRNLCVVFGLRRTGKTYGMQQAILLQSKYVSWSKMGLIICDESDDLFRLYDEVQNFKNAGGKYLFIDEVTFLPEFIDYAHNLANVYTCGGMKIVLSGTHSYAFILAASDTLYDRCIFINTSNIGFKEFVNLTKRDSLKEFIQFGGLFQTGKLGNPFTHNGFINSNGIRQYINTAIVENIVHSLRTYKDGKLLQEDSIPQVRNYVYSVILSRTHSMIDKIMNPLKLQELNGVLDLPRFKDSLSKDYRSKIKSNITAKFLDIFDYNTDTELNPVTASYVDEALVEMGILFPVSDMYLDSDSITFQYGSSNILNPIAIRTFITDWVLNEVHTLSEPNLEQSVKDMADGFINEEIVRFELMQQYRSGNLHTLNFMSSKDRGEIDFIIIDGNKVNLYELKNSSKIVDNQAKHLCNKDVMNAFIERGYQIGKRAVIYNGITTVHVVNGIEIKYVNISEFLRNIEDRGCIESYKEAGRISAREERKSGRLSKIYESIGYGSNGYGSESNHTHEF